MSDFVLHQNRTSGPAFVAHRADEVIGWCDIRRHALPAFAHRDGGCGGVARARDRLSVARRGAGRRLPAGVCRDELDARTDNTRAIALNEKIGFVPEGLPRDLFFIDGEYFDAIAMAIVRRHRSPLEATTYVIWNMPLPAVVFGPVIANGSFTSTPAVRCVGPDFRAHGPGGRIRASERPALQRGPPLDPRALRWHC
jgi:hypothetical protein